MTVRVVTLGLLVAISGCASTSGIDLSRVEPQCGQNCSANYSTCVSKFTIFPLEVQHQCTTALKLCAQSCPARKPTT